MIYTLSGNTVQMAKTTAGVAVLWNIVLVSFLNKDNFYNVDIARACEHV